MEIIILSRYKDSRNLILHLFTIRINLISRVKREIFAEGVFIAEDG